MSSSDIALQILNVLAVITPVLVFGYAAYWALSIRKALHVRLYRNQALGIGLVAIAFVWDLIPAPPVITNTWVGVVSTYATLLLFFYWTDASILASRRSDPLLRDTLSWSKFRVPVWIAFLATGGVISVVSAYANATGNVALFNEISTGYVVTSIPGIIYGITWLIPLSIGAIYLPAIALRTKDPTLKRHYEWFGLFAIALAIAGGILGFLTFPAIEGDLLFLVEFVLMGYFLYRSARSLVPLNRISLDNN
jgi:hypothetical protein